jgi:hypothetical protein
MACRHLRQVDAANTITPTLSLKRGGLTYAWRHKVEGGGLIKTVIDPYQVSASSGWRLGGLNSRYDSQGVSAIRTLRVHEQQPE